MRIGMEIGTGNYGINTWSRMANLKCRFTGRILKTLSRRSAIRIGDRLESDLFERLENKLLNRIIGELR
jgi:hypothetical protein